MQTIRKLIKLSLTSMLIFSFSSAQELDEKTKYELVTLSDKSIGKVAGQLQMALLKKAKEGGIAHAATFCSTNATSLAKEASKSLNAGVSLKRITSKPRNMKNLANEEQVEILKQLQKSYEKTGKIETLVKQKSENHFQVYKPIIVMAKCLECHGDKSFRNKEAYEIISKKYPQDKAIDYKLYDFRGAFLVNINK